MPGRVDASQHDLTHRDLVPVLQRVVRMRGLCRGMDADGDVVLEREPAVARDVVGVRVRLDRPNDPYVLPPGLVEVLLDREPGVDDDRASSLRVADEVRRTAERVVDELREDHDSRP